MGSVGEQKKASPQGLDEGRNWARQAPLSAVEHGHAGWCIIVGSESNIRVSGSEKLLQLYLDIDGVLLTKGGNLAQGAETFLRWCIGNHEPFWNSTRTRDGSTRGAHRAFHNLLDMELIEAVRPTRWETLKTEPLPIGSHDWAWVDDEILHAERAVLASNDALDRFIQISVDREPSALVELPAMLRSI